MALRPCPACQRPMRAAEGACPFCQAVAEGPPPAGRRVRAAIGGGAVVVAGLTGCVGPFATPVYGAPAPPSASPTASPAASPTPTPVPPYGAVPVPSPAPSQTPAG